MKPIIVILAAVLFCSYGQAKAQDDDYVYLIDETLLEVEVVGLTNKSIKFRHASNRVQSTVVSKLVMAFNQVGDYIVFSGAFDDYPTIDFTAAAKVHTIDLLITMNRAVLPVYLVTITDHEIIYIDATNPRGEQAVSKDLLAAAIYRDGRHELYVSPSQGAEILSAVQADFQSLKRKQYEKPPPPIETSPDVKPVEHKNPIETSPDVRPVEHKNITAASSVSDDTALFVPVPTEEDQKEGPAKQNTDFSKAPSKSRYIVTHGGRRHVNLNEYQEKGLAKLESLRKYISIISNSQTSWIQANEAINKACALFVSESATVEVSAAEHGEESRQSIRAYLNQLKQFKLGKYNRVEVTLINFRYVTNLTEGADGTYYGVIAYEQSFKGIINNKIVQNSVTGKRISVILVKRPKGPNNIPSEELDLMLSDISVVKDR